MNSATVSLRDDEGSSTSGDSLVVEPSIRRWETGSRVYTAEVTVDLFGDLVLKCTNGGIGKRHYRERTVACGEQAIAAALRHLARLRRAHAYTLVEVRPGDRTGTISSSRLPVPPGLTA